MSSIQQEIDTYKKELDQWIQSIGLSNHQPSSDSVEEILSYDRTDLKKRSSTDLCEDAFILYQYAMFLQNKANECSTFLKWSRYTMNKLLGDDKHKLLQYERKVELRFERIVYLARRIETLGQAINSLVRARKVE